jgi:hypothetical protein
LFSNFLVRVFKPFGNKKTPHPREQKLLVANEAQIIRFYTGLSETLLFNYIGIIAWKVYVRQPSYLLRFGERSFTYPQLKGNFLTLVLGFSNARIIIHHFYCFLIYRYHSRQRRQPLVLEQPK